MITRESGLSGIMMAAAGAGASGGGTVKRGRPRKAAAADERDPSVVALQEADGGEAGREVADDGSEAPEGVSDPANGVPAALEPEFLAPEVTNGRALAAKALFTDDGWLKLPAGLPFEGYREIVARFGTLHENMLWHAGDLQVQGEALYGQDYSQILDLLASKDYSESTLSVAKTVASKIPAAERFPTLSWNHHVAVMSFNKKERHRWLDQARSNEWTVKELKKGIDAAGGTPSIKAERKRRKAKGGEADTGTIPADNAPAASEPVAEAAAQPVTAKGGGVTLEMLNKADEADKQWYEALERARKDMELEGAFDYDALNTAGRAMAQALMELLSALK